LRKPPSARHPAGESGNPKGADVDARKEEAVELKAYHHRDRRKTNLIHHKKRRTLCRSLQVKMRGEKKKSLSRDRRGGQITDDGVARRERQTSSYGWEVTWAKKGGFLFIIASRKKKKEHGATRRRGDKKAQQRWGNARYCGSKGLPPLRAKPSENQR